MYTKRELHLNYMSTEMIRTWFLGEYGFMVVVFYHFSAAFLQENMILQLTNQLQIEGDEKRKLHVVIEEQER